MFCDDRKQPLSDLLKVLRRVERGQATVLKSTLSQYEELKDALKSLEDPVLRVKDDTAAVLDAVNGKSCASVPGL